MAQLKISSEWWTSPTEGENGGLIIVTGRKEMDGVKHTGKFVYRVEVTWKYGEEGMPDFATSSTMEKITDTLNDMFDKDPVAVMTGIYTGCGERNWVFYAQSLKIFERKFNEALKDFDILPISIYTEKDPEWNEYAEMREQSEIDEGD